MRKKIASFFGFLLYIILILEILLRIPFIYRKIFDNYYEKTPRLIHKLVKFDKEYISLYWKLKDDFPLQLIYPDNSFFFSGEKIITAKINKLGFRGNDFEKKKKQDTIRIAFIGDSFTFGWGVPDGETYPEKVCVELKKNINKINFECLNFAMFGYNIFNTYNVFKDYVLEYNPDLIVFGLTINDMEENLFYLSENEKKIERTSRIPDLFEGAPTITNFENDVYAYSYVYRLFKFLIYIKKIKEATITYFYNLYTPLNEKWLEINLKSLEKIKEETYKRKIPLLCLYFPVFYKLKEGYPFLETHKIMQNIFQKNEIPYIDFYYIFNKYDERKLWVHPKDKHPNSFATDIIAKEVSTFIINNFLKLQ